jgi:hypothetical protein
VRLQLTANTNTTFNPSTGSTASCRVWGHDRRACGGGSDANANQTTCAALGCCYLGFTDPISKAGDTGGHGTPTCFHPQPIAAANLNSSNDVFDCTVPLMLLDQQRLLEELLLLLLLGRFTLDGGLKHTYSSD